jgi:hypothetical protein
MELITRGNYAMLHIESAAFLTAKATNEDG